VDAAAVDAAAVDAAADRAAAAERLRIARELHDVVAHHVSLMAVQAEAVGALLPARPDAAAASADLIGSTARSAMNELRRLLGVLRFKENPEPERERLTPVPSMSDLGQLVDTARESGLSVRCEVSGPVTALPPGVLVADDQELVRAGFRLILEASGLVVAGEAADGAAAVELAAAECPDVVLMDIRMPVMDGLAATRQLTAAGQGAPKVVILTTFDLDDYVYEALRSGASGFLLKDAPRPT